MKYGAFALGWILVDLAKWRWSAVDNTNLTKSLWHWWKSTKVR